MEQLTKSAKMDFTFEFIEYRIQSAVSSSDQDLYKIPVSGICHGSCIASSLYDINLFFNRHQMLTLSTSLQQDYQYGNQPSSKEKFDKLSSIVYEELCYHDLQNIPSS